MGFLTDGETLDWTSSLPFIPYVKEHGLIQFLHIYNATKERTGDCLKWGDEIEYIIVQLDDEHQTVTLPLRVENILEELMREEEEGKTDLKTLWRPEYGRYMVEGTPGRPYGDCVTEFRKVEPNMQLRRQRVKSLLHAGEYLLTLCNFPLLGVGSFTSPSHDPLGPVSNSLFTPDQLIFPHNRFATLTHNIRTRRGSKVEIKVPVFQDTHTGKVDNRGFEGALDTEIYMDSMVFGMGMCCLQCTFQCTDIDESRYLYDQLAVMAPIMLALTAGTPIYRGYLSAIDARWHVISAAVDDRTEEERGVVPSPDGKFLTKSRYASIDAYIANDDLLKDSYNDIPLSLDKGAYKKMLEAGIDDRLSRHIAHLFVRDPLVIYKDKIEIDDHKHSDHFENIQSTNWHTVRFKPPPPGSQIGWRTEFRPMEIQITDFENAAFVVFMILLTRTIRSYGLNLYIPLSKVDENMNVAAEMDAVLRHKFYFRRDISRDSKWAEKDRASVPLHLQFDLNGGDSDAYDLMTIDEIMNGSQRFQGLIPLVEAYFESLNIDIETAIVVRRYFSLIKQRASGQLLTAAAWTRKQVREHPEYKGDSVVSERIVFDLIKKIDDVASGKEKEPLLFGDLYPQLPTDPDLILYFKESEEGIGASTCG